MLKQIKIFLLVLVAMSLTSGIVSLGNAKQDAPDAKYIENRTIETRYGSYTFKPD